jgi:hypothetical protein
MTLAAASIAITPGTGATVATVTVGGKSHQVMMLSEFDGNIVGSNPIYRLIVPPQAVGASKVFLDIFNATGSGKVLRILSCVANVLLDTAVTATTGVQLSLTRTSTVGTGGTTATADGTSLTAATITRFDSGSATLPAGVTARAAPTGGGTAGAVLGTRHLFTDETSSVTSCEFLIGAGAKVLVPETTGLRIVQGTVASVGSIAFEITFEAQ